MNPTPRNAHEKDAWKTNESNDKLGVGDYGKSGIENKPNERDITQQRTVTNNLVSEIKKIITPIQDIFRKTRKENTIGNNRPEGNMNAAIPSKMTVYDSNDIARTTIKETNIHNNRLGNMGVESKKSQTYNPEDTLRTTIKETSIHNSNPNNPTPQQPKASTTYDPEDIPATTLKETLLESDNSGNIQLSSNKQSSGAYITSRVDAKNTNRQFTSDYEYTGTADGDVGKGHGRGYLANRYEAKHTNKQFTSDYEYTGSAKSYANKKKNYFNYYNARLNPNKEQISLGRKPTKQSVKLNAGEDLVNIQHKKIDSDRINIREPSESRVFQTPPTKNNCGLTNIKDKLSETNQRSRINPETLTPFINNPYTQPLNSAV